MSLIPGCVSPTTRVAPVRAAALPLTPSLAPEHGNTLHASVFHVAAGLRLEVRKRLFYEGRGGGVLLLLLLLLLLLFFCLTENLTMECNPINSHMTYCRYIKGEKNAKNIVTMLDNFVNRGEPRPPKVYYVQTRATPIIARAAGPPPPSLPPLFPPAMARCTKVLFVLSLSEDSVTPLSAPSPLGPRLTILNPTVGVNGYG